MKAIQNGDGHVGLTTRAYPVEESAEIRRGQVVKLSGGTAVKAESTESGALLGIAAENHSGEEDVLNPRSNGGELLVYDNPMLIFECPAPVFSAVSGSATTVAASVEQVECTTANAFAGGRVKLKKKGAGSGNTDRAGTVKPVTAFASASDTAIFTVPEGGVAGEGDEFYLFPPIGSAGTLALEQSGSGVMTAAGTGCTAIKVVGWDLEKNMLRLMAAEHSLGVGN